MNRILLLGLGNTILRDDGIGVRVAEDLRDHWETDPAVDIEDGGTQGLGLLPLMEGREKVLIVDAVDRGLEPGTTTVLENEAIPAALTAKLSVHHIGLADVLFALRLLGRMPSEVCLVGIQPLEVDLGLELTEEIGRKRGELARMAAAKLEEWGVRCALRRQPES